MLTKSKSQMLLYIKEACFTLMFKGKGMVLHGKQIYIYIYTPSFAFVYKVNLLSRLQQLVEVN